jgi:hypothetical protein
MAQQLTGFMRSTQAELSTRPLEIGSVTCLKQNLCDLGSRVLATENERTGKVHLGIVQLRVQRMYPN